MTETENVSDDNMRWIYYYSARPLWKYISEVLNVDITDVCAFVSKEDAYIETDGTKLIPRVVQMPHLNELTSKVYNNDVCFLINGINTVFEALKVTVKKDDEFILKKYAFKLDSEHKLYLVDVETMEPVSDTAIAVVQE